VIAIATDMHIQAFARGLDATALDTTAGGPSDGLIALDAATTLSALTPAGEIDAEAFARLVATPIRLAAESGRSVRVYGEMVSLLWQAGEVLTAIKLEELWNELADELPFALFCSYAAASMESPEHADALHHVCALHSSVLPAAPGPTLLDGQIPSKELTGEFSSRRDAPGRARRLVVAALRRWGIDETLVHNAALVLSELANNAVIHARSSFSIEVCAHESALRIAVADTRPHARVGEAGSLIPRLGHGLGVIEVLSSEWGVEDRPGGKVVWAELRDA
jgi:anti-sigma regulatory factor (Ser/Thr protein kinase)